MGRSKVTKQSTVLMFTKLLHMERKGKIPKSELEAMAEMSAVVVSLAAEAQALLPTPDEVAVFVLTGLVCLCA